MSTENYHGFKFRYVRDRESPGDVKVYVEKGINSRTEHLYKGKGGSPPHICIKPENKPSSYSEAKGLAHKWADKYGG